MREAGSCCIVVHREGKPLAKIVLLPHSADAPIEQVGRNHADEELRRMGKAFADFLFSSTHPHFTDALIERFINQSRNRDGWGFDAIKAAVVGGRTQKKHMRERREGRGPTHKRRKRIIRIGGKKDV